MGYSEYQKDLQKAYALFEKNQHFFSQEIEVIRRLFPEAQWDAALTAGRKGELVVRWFVRTAKTMKYYGYRDFYGHLCACPLEQTREQAEALVERIRLQLPKETCSFSYKAFQSPSVEMIQTFLPIEKWMYLCLDYQKSEPENTLDEHIDRENPYVLPMFDLWEKEGLHSEELL